MALGLIYSAVGVTAKYGLSLGNSYCTEPTKLKYYPNAHY